MNCHVVHSAVDQILKQKGLQEKAYVDFVTRREEGYYEVRVAFMVDNENIQFFVNHPKDRNEILEEVDFQIEKNLNGLRCFSKYVYNRIMGDSNED